MNEVKLSGNLRKTSVSQGAGPGSEPWIWLNVDGQWIPAHCRGAALEAASRCPNGTRFEIQGILEYVQFEPDKWGLRIVATQAKSPGAPATSVAGRQKPVRRRDWEEDLDDYPHWIEISPGFYMDALTGEYKGNPDGRDE